DLACTQVSHVITTLGGKGLGTAIWSLTNVPATGSGRIDLDTVLQTFTLNQVLKERMGGGRSTDVPETDKENARLHHAPFSSNARTRRKSSSVSTPAGGCSSATATWIFSPFHMARSCSRLSATSRGAGTHFTKFLRSFTR